jgi:stage V sporulation protein SpoVS
VCVSNIVLAHNNHARLSELAADTVSHLVAALAVIRQMPMPSVIDLVASR